MGSVIGYQEAHGPIATFETDVAGKIRKIEASIEPIQDLHGYDSPWPAGGGKNKFDKNAVTANKLLERRDGSLSNNNKYAVSDYIPVSEGQTITFTKFNYYYQRYYNSEKTLLDTLPINAATATIPAGVSYLRVSLLQTNLDTAQIELGSTATAYEPYSNICPITGWTGANVSVNGNVINVTFPSAVGTVYGGTLDVVNGELVVDRAMVDLGTLTWNRMTNPRDILSNTYLFNARISNSESANAPKIGFSAILSTYKWVNSYIHFNEDKVAGYIYNMNIAIRDDTYADTATFKAAMSGVQLVYELATPITYQLTPQEINTIIGTNTIYADTGDTSVIYPKTITPIETVSNVSLMELRRNIIVAQAYEKTVDVTLNLGTHQVYPTDSIESLRKYLTVISRGNEAIVTNYTLRGSIDTIGNHQIIVDCHPGIATIQVPVVANPSGILYEWDFTKSLTDERQNYTAILKTGEADEVPGKSAGTTPPVRGDTGVVFNNAQQVLRLLDSNIDSSALLFGKTIQVDVAEFNYIYSGTTIATEQRRACFIMFGDSVSNGGSMLYTTGIILNNEWKWILRKHWRENIQIETESALLNGKNAISGHTIGLYINQNGIINFYADNVYKNKTNNTLYTDLHGLQIGAGGRPQYGGAFYNARITGVRIYDGNVYSS